ncbi:MAG: hypothetical protein JWM99_4211 [Verrucomicrobiales bacterium]|nr:hypothetical protein [Verrucomicrobiales bacterium]
MGEGKFYPALLSLLKNVQAVSNPFLFTDSVGDTASIFFGRRRKRHR